MVEYLCSSANKIFLMHLHFSFVIFSIFLVKCHNEVICMVDVIAHYSRSHVKLYS
jgi:hypothetical protein